MFKKDFIRNHKLKLKILSPIHIGDGKENVKKTEFIFDRENAQLLFPNTRLFADFLEKHKFTDDFCKFIQASPQNGLKEWLDRHHLGRVKYEPFCSYVLDMDSNIEEIDKLNDVCLFMKDKDSRPYIPGSSIKGVLRTAVIWKTILDNQDYYKKQYWELIKKSMIASNSENKYDSRNATNELKRIEAQIHKDVFYKIEFEKGRRENKIPNDVFRGLAVSDSKSIDTKKLILIQKKDFIVNPEKELAISTLPIFRESLKPGTEIEFTISFDDTFLKLTNTFKDFSIQTILESLDIMSEFYSKNIIHNAGLHPDIITNQSLGGNLNLGAGTGYLIKTLPYLLAPNINEALHPVRCYMESKFKKAEHMQKDQIISPRAFKIGYFEGNPLELGWSRLEVIS
jgi:CRISPR-associated protein Csm5